MLHLLYSAINISVYVRHKADVSTCLASRCEHHYIELQKDPHHIECYHPI